MLDYAEDDFTLTPQIPEKYYLTAEPVFFGSVAEQRPTCDTLEFTHLLNNSYQCTWQYFTLPSTDTATIIDYRPAPVGCGTWATAAVAIIKFKNDTIRVIDLCNLNTMYPGQKVKITPGTNPNFQVHIPASFFVEGTRGQKLTKKQKQAINNQPTIWHTNEAYDKTILKTTWAELTPQL